MAKICPQCGKQLKDKATFCGKCGKKLEPELKDKTPQESKAASSSDVIGLIRSKKKWLIGIGGLLLAVVLVLVIINPANSPKAVFEKYLSCMRSENDAQIAAISYEANFSKDTSSEMVVGSYQQRFSSADDSYKSGGKVNLLKGKSIRIIDVATPTQVEITSRRAALADHFRNTNRITDIRNISFEVKRGGEEKPTVGTAELICVTGKWYIGEVTGI